jgi:hypothetical protein
MKPLPLLLISAIATLFVSGCSKSGHEAVIPATPPTPMTASTLAAALNEGTNIVGQAFGLLSSNLQSAIQQGGISNALPYCSVAALPLTLSIAESRGVAIRRFTHRARNPQGRADEVEMAVIRNFQDSMPTSNSPSPPALVTNLAPGKVTFFAPIVLNKPLCLKCHGEPGKDILPQDLVIIDGLYPQDQARGFKLGELRGAWRVDFPVSALQSP